MPEAKDRAVTVRPSPLTSSALVFVGFCLVLNGVMFPLLIHDQSLSDVMKGLVFISLPGVVFGSLAFLQGWLRFRTALVFDDDGLRLTIPTPMGGGCFFPLRQGQTKWSEVQRLTSTQCVYSILRIPFSIRQYTLQTAQDRYTLAPSFCPHLDKLFTIMSEQTGVSIEDLGVEQRSLWRRSPSPS
jgi:hypothetical protein